MRISAELLNSGSEQRNNPLGERELILRGLAIPVIEHLGITRDAYDTIDLSDNRLMKLDNFPKSKRLSSLLCTGNLIESIDDDNFMNNVPNIKSMTLSYNQISTFHNICQIGKGCPQLEFLSLIGNPVTRRQHYRLYTIRHIPSLKVLDFIKIKPSERDRADRLANSAAGAALESDVQVEAAAARRQQQQQQKQQKIDSDGEQQQPQSLSSKTFVPGEGKSAEESFVTNFTKEQKEMIRTMVSNAKSPAEIEQIEESVKRGIFPNINTGTTLPPPLPPPSPPPEDTTTTTTTKTTTTTREDNDSDENNRKRPAVENNTAINGDTNDTNKKSRIEE